MGEAFATSAASKLVSKLVEYLFAPIGRQFGYVLCYRSHVEDLKNGVRELGTAKERLQCSVNEAEYNGKPIHTDVNDWLESVTKEAEEAENLLREGENAKDACFRGWFPNPVVRHPIGRKVKKMTLVIQELHKKSNFTAVHYENPPIGIVTATTSADRSADNNEDVLESRALVAEKVIKAIADDNVCVVGVYGPGGIGKSKLLADIERQTKKDKLFDMVAIANVSRNPDIRRIQGEIAYALGLKIMNEETVRGRADLLHRRLESDSKKNILIILDNLWKKLELNEVGIPCGYDNKVRGCKLLLTSRNREVLRADMGSDREFRLNELEEGEARRLFERTMGDKVNDLDIKPWVDGVVQNCGGLPLLIVSLAKRLKHGDLVAWRNALTNIDVSDVKSLVELNYKDLEDERIRKLFLVCALDTRSILMRCILAYCMGLGLYEKFSKTIEDARNKLIMDLRSLQDSSLLLDSEDMEVLKMHDIFADVAISITTTEWKALVGRKDYGFKEWSKDELRKCTALSILSVGIDELPEKLDCPNLRMLLISESNPSLRIPEPFFESTEKLQVLELTCLYFTSLPLSIEFLENLNSLCLDYCYMEDVTSLGKLKGLQFLSFHGSAITRLPKEIGGLTKLRFLDLIGCTGLKVIEPGVLGSLINLEELHIEDSFDQWEAEGEAPRSNASLAELKNLKNLSTLSIAIPHSTDLPRYLPFGKLNKHKIQIGKVWDWSGKYKESRALKLKLDSGNLLLEEWVQKCLQRTQDLHLDGLQDGDDSIHDLCVEGFQELKHLHVQNSPLVQYVVHSTEKVQCSAFTRLESLFLENLNNLEKICHGYLALESFSKLKIVKVDKCGEIIHLFPLSMTRILPQLEDIEISRCQLIQQIATYADTDQDRDGIYDDPKVKPSNLRRLALRNLPEMMSFCKTTNHSVDFFDEQQLIKLQSLEAMIIERCQLIQGVFDLEGLTTSGEVVILSQLRELTLIDLPSLGHIWSKKNPRRTSCFPNLRILKVQNCESLRFLFSSSMAKALRQIKEMDIAGCKLMEEIIDGQEEQSEEAATTDTLEFPLLTSLSLEDLPNLKTFSYGKYYVHCPSLTSLRIFGCPKMMTFSSFEGKQQCMTADTGLQQAFGRINSGLSSTVFFNEKVHFPSLEELVLSSMCKLRRIWPNQLHGQSFCKLESLTIGRCENLLHIFPSNSVDRLHSLNEIEVVECPSLEALFEPISLSDEKRRKPSVLSALKKMKLLNLPRLRDILKGDCKVTLACPSLMEVNVSHCHSLPYLFSSAMATTLDKLAILDVSYCNNLQCVIAMEEGKGKAVETVKFRQLSTLKLSDLENLISFCSASCASDGLDPLFDEKLAFPKLEELHIKGFQQEELWSDKILTESFCRLKVLEVKQCPNLMNVIPSFMWKKLLYSMDSLKVEKCPRLRYLFTMSTAKSLGRLQYLGLCSCGEMEYIVAKEEDKPKEPTDKIVISQLVTLYFHNMPKLKSFYQGKHISEWPSLKEFTVEDCKAVEVILGNVSCRRPEDSIARQQPLLLMEKVEFPSMESMKISHMDNMEKIWFDELASNAFSKLKTLIVDYCPKLSSIFSSNAILPRFRNLEKLTVTNCGSLEVVFHIQELNMSGAHSASTFQLRELNLERLPKMKHVWSGHSRGNLTFERLRCLKAVHCQSLKSLFPSSVAKSMAHLEELEVCNCGVEEIIAEEEGGVGTSASDLFFPRLTVLILLELPELRSFYMNSHTSTWPHLKQLQVMHCGKMRSISFVGEIENYQDSTTSENQAAFFSFEKVFPNLEKLRLAREDAVMMPQHYIFGNLRKLAFGCYHHENVAFPSNFLLQRFPNLELLSVSCSSFEDIFPEDAFGHGGATPFGGANQMEKPLRALGNVKQLELIGLWYLKRVWKDGSLMAEILKQIEVLHVAECPSLSIVFPSATSFQSLTLLQVENCAGLLHMMTCSAVTSLVHLSRLFLINCGAMEDVVIDDGNEVGDISFPKLRQLTLEGLPRLESFSPTYCAFSFPSLVHIIVKQCPKMNIFCKGALRTPQLEKVLLSVQDDEGRWDGDLNTTIHSLWT